MSLHDQIITDDLEVFIDLDDFAEWHDINGTNCRAVLQEITTSGKLTESANPDYDLYGTVVELHCRTQDLDEIPVSGQGLFLVDDKPFSVVAVDENMGILTIRLQANDR